MSRSVSRRLFEESGLYTRAGAAAGGIGYLHGDSEGEEIMSRELSAPELRDLVAKGRKRGVLTDREIMDALQSVDLTPDQIDEMYEALGAYGVDIIGPGGEGNGDGDGGGDVLRGFAGDLADAFLWAAEAFEDSEAGIGVAVCHQPCRQFRHCGPVAEGADRAYTFPQNRAEPGEGGGVEAEAEAVLQPPAEAVRGELEGGGRGMRGPLTGGEVGHETAARAEPERIAGGEDDGGLAAMGEDRGGVEGHGPGLAPVSGLNKRQVSRAAEDGLRGGECVAACGRQGLWSIFAETDDGEPGISHDPRPASGRNHRGRPHGPSPGRGEG